MGTLQNEVALYQIDCCRLDSVVPAHDDYITALALGKHLAVDLCPVGESDCSVVCTGIGDGMNEENFVLASASSDDCVKLWRVRRVGSSPHFRFRPPTDLIAELEHDSSVASLDFHPYDHDKLSYLFGTQLELQ